MVNNDGIQKSTGLGAKRNDNNEGVKSQISGSFGTWHGGNLFRQKTFPIHPLVAVFLQSQSRHDVHALEFLEEEFAGVGNFQAGHLRRGLASVTPARVA